MLMAVALWQLIEIKVHHMLIAVELFLSGFVVVFFIAGSGRIQDVSRPFRHAELTRIVPSAAFIQISNPRSVLSCGALAFVLVSIISACAVKVENPGALALSVLIAVIGFALLMKLMTPGATALHGLLVWTGIPVWKAVNRLMFTPIFFAALLICPVTICALMLRDWGWVLASLVSLMVAGYFTLIWIVHDLVKINHDSSPVFVLLHMMVPVIFWFSIGPMTILAICMHIGWLCWHADRLWNTSR